MNPPSAPSSTTPPTQKRGTKRQANGDATASGTLGPISQNEVMARLASKSNYQNILDGDHTALGLSYNTDLHSGIELRRTSHKAAEQKRRDSLKNCFDDLRHMIPNIQEKSPSKVFLLKKSFDYICNLKSDVAKRDLELARLKAEHNFMTSAMQAWFTSLPEDSPFKTAGGHGDKSLIESWTMPEEDIQKATVKESEAFARAVEITEISAAAVEAARTQPGGQNKGSRESQGDGEDSEDEGTIAPRGKKGGSKRVKNGDVVMQLSSESDPSNVQTVSASHQTNAKSNKSQEDDDEDEDNEEEDGEAEDQEMADGTLTNT
ncbi:hypothetical protein BGZ70_009917 [Mortierella alpina]|uniref:BHLH domain-containing protein n=1 Tax=Mortierella alpina TaxID=64518 RepID=A0A9P6J0F7_MORAP|nr:hypothetical protein BGZ70_009917 [Mortierella alpina]